MQKHLFKKRKIIINFFFLLLFQQALSIQVINASQKTNTITPLKIKKRYSSLLNDDFLTICGFHENDFKALTYIYKNSNKNYIPSFEDIKNEDIRTALYIAIFNKISPNIYLNQYAINMIGLDNALKVKSFLYSAIKYAINEKNATYSEIREHLKDRRLTSFEILQLFKNKKFANLIILNNKDIIDDVFLKTIFFNAIGSNIVSKDDMLLYKQLYGHIFFDDQFILQQIRIRLWRKNLNNIDFIISLLKEKNNIDKARMLVRFYNYRFLKKIKGRNKTNNKNQQSSYNCYTFAGFDMYSDLVCIADNSKNKLLVKKILKDNKNPFFLPEKWFAYRNSYIRENISQNTTHYEDYDIITNSGFLTGEKYYMQQFNAGLVAFLVKSYNYAIEHFSNSFNYATQIEEKTKAGYWLAMSYKKINDYTNYSEILKKISEYPITLYGQMAIEELGLNPEDGIVNLFNGNKLEVYKLCKNQTFIAGYIDQIFRNGVSSLLIDFVDQNKDNKDTLFSALSVIESDFNSNISRGFAMYTKKYNVVSPDSSYPIIDIENDSLVNAVIQKESNFNIKAVSNKGARGVMQIIPSTGARLAKHMGIEYKQDLLHRPDYNIKMGKFYLDSLLDRYNGHKILALSAYNAGPGNVNKWIQKNGDIRKMEDNEDVAMWIEKIPFPQTRTYIVKILGSEMVYDVLLKLQNNQ